MKRVIIFYSYTNNTRSIVQKIKEKYGYDSFEIKPTEEYSDDYNLVVSSEEKLVPMDYQPDIQEMDVDFSNYDEVILCTPVWWYSVASPVNTFLHNYDLKGKTIIPVATNGGWLGRTFENIEKVTGCKLEKPLSLKFDENRLVDPYEFEDWLNGLEESEDLI
ncbi:MAG: NAD(P)H-dependent oxidoreductase [Bacilli bacterium]|nr:NAD(P)H-dependent oxidoreductase [Bacilli bacterium]